jgi:hypothetical protein
MQLQCVCRDTLAWLISVSLGVMNHTLRYRSSRAEVWRWYWRAWRKKLWAIHVLVALAVSFVRSGSSLGAVHTARWLLFSAVLFPVIVVLFAAIPQVMFKETERTLEVSPEGWSTRIGKQKGSRSWTQVASIHEDGGAVEIVGTNGNALIIPARAFSSREAKELFLNDVRQWHRKHAA